MKVVCVIKSISRRKNFHMDETNKWGEHKMYIISDIVVLCKCCLLLNCRNFYIPIGVSPLRICYLLETNECIRVSDLLLLLLVGNTIYYALVISHFLNFLPLNSSDDYTGNIEEI